MSKTSYHNDTAFRAESIEKAKKHVELDMLIKGHYGHMNGAFKGCSVGCDAYEITGTVVEKNIHALTAEHFGWPVWLEHLRDMFFENLEDNTNFHVRFKEAIKEGVTEERFEKVKARFLIFILNENIECVETLDISDDQKKQVVDVSKRCKAVWQGYLDTGNFDKEAARSAASAAWSAAWSAARSAASAARSAAWSAARSATRSAASAARSAELSAELSATRSAAFEKYADKLIELLEAA